MKKIFLVLMLWLMPLAIIAQEQDPWIGEWTSEAYTDVDWERSPKDSDAPFLYTQFKIVIKITKYGDSYMVRKKTIKVDDPSYVSYGLPINVASFDGSTMELRSFVEKEPFTVNGEVDTYRDLTYYFRLQLIDGVLHYHFYKFHDVEYDRHMRYRGGKDNYIPSTNVSSHLRLFNDNW